MIQYDIPTLSALLKEKKIKTFINLPSDPKEIEAYTLSCESKERKGKMIRWMLALSETEEVIGSVVLKKISKKHGKANVGYRLGKTYEGKGLMTEALHAILSYLFHDTGIQRIQARIRTDNTSSIALAERLGFVREGLARHLYFSKKQDAYYDAFLYGLLKEDFGQITKKKI